MRAKIIAGIVVVAIVAGVGIYSLISSMLSNSEEVLAPEEDKEVVIDKEKDEDIEEVLPFTTPLTGIPTEEEVLVRPLAVTVENSPNARPQSGLKDADVVYEMLAEGGITRFLAIYQHGQAENIGPIRSARHYSAYLAHDFDGVYVHVGGSPMGLDYVRQREVENLDAFYIATGEFWRTSDRRAPHNLYSSTDNMRNLLEERNLERKPNFSPWPFVEADQPLSEGLAASEVNIMYPLQISQVRYVYNKSDNMYYRYMAGKPHLDRQSESQLTAANIIVQFVNTNAIPGDTEGRLNIQVVGQGRALVFSNGYAYEAVWEKSGKRDRTVFKSSDGKEISLVPGQTWIQLVRTNTQVDY